MKTQIVNYFLRKWLLIIHDSYILIDIGLSLKVLKDRVTIVYYENDPFLREHMQAVNRDNN